MVVCCDLTASLSFARIAFRLLGGRKLGKLDFNTKWAGGPLVVNDLRGGSLWTGLALHHVLLGTHRQVVGLALPGFKQDHHSNYSSKSTWSWSRGPCWDCRDCTSGWPLLIPRLFWARNCFVWVYCMSVMFLMQNCWWIGGVGSLGVEPERSDLACGERCDCYLKLHRPVGWLHNRTSIFPTILAKWWQIACQLQATGLEPFSLILTLIFHTACAKISSSSEYLRNSVPHTLLEGNHHWTCRCGVDDFQLTYGDIVAHQNGLKKIDISWYTHDALSMEIGTSLKVA